MATYRIPTLEKFEWQPPVINYQSAPPGSPAKGQRYIVLTTGTGVWAGHDEAIATFDGTNWLFDLPGAVGWVTYLQTGSKYMYYGGAVWAELDMKPKTHAHAASEITSGSLDGDRLAAPTTTKRGGVKATGTPSGKFLKDDDTWATPGGGDMTKAVYDTDADNIVDKAEAVDDGAGNATTAAQVKEAYTRRAAYDADYKCLLFTI